MRYLYVFVFLTFLFLFNSLAAQKAVAVDENFNTGIIPAGWNVTDTLNDNYTWEVIAAYQTNTLDGSSFAMVNSDAAGAVDMSEILESPSFDLASNTSVIIEFDQYFNYFGGGGSEVGDVDVWNGSSWVNVYSVNAETGSWATPDHQIIDASAYKNANFKIRFWYHHAKNDYYWAIDNVKIWDPQPNDVGISRLISPISDFEMGGTETVSVMVKNFGTLSQTSIPVSFQIDGGTVINETLDNSFGAFTTLAPGDSFAYTFTATANLTAYQIYNFKCWTGLASDTDPANDTLNTTVKNTMTYVQFESDSLWTGMLGVETDGNYFYMSFWNTPGLFAKYTLAGEFIDTFSVAGLTVGIRDMAYDPVSGHFFGGCATPFMYELHLDTVVPSLIGQVSTPSGAMVRHIAYDDHRDGFWIGNLNSDIYLIEKTGSLMTSATGIVNPIPNTSLATLDNRYGLAYDNWSCPGEYLWVFCQATGLSDVYLAQIDIYTGLPTGRNFDLNNQFTLSGTNPGAGGLFTHEDLFSGTVSIGGIIQNASNDPSYSGNLFILDLGIMHPNPSLNITSLFPADASVDVQLNHNVIVKFAEDIAGLNLSTITIKDGPTPLANINATVSNDSLIITHDDFNASTLYTVNIPQGTVGWECSENEEIEWSFTTGTVSVQSYEMTLPFVYPNPANNGLFIDAAADNLIILRDITGKQIFSKEINNNHYFLNIESLARGVYIIEFKSAKLQYSLKFIKQ